MKFLKWLLFVILGLIVLGLVIPLFLPSTVSVSTEKSVMLSPEKVFHAAASYLQRGAWDPWLETEPTANWEVTPVAGYVGSTYTWNGEKIGSGKMEIDSVVFGKYILSHIFFGENPEASRVEWQLQPAVEGTLISWKFTAEASYPVERIFLNTMKGNLRKDFERGMENFKNHFEANPPGLSNLSDIGLQKQEPMFALVVKATGTMESMGNDLGRLYGLIMEESEKQDLTIAGAPFVHYLDFNTETGISNYLAGLPVTAAGKSSGAVLAKTYPGMEVLTAIHTGPYEELPVSYSLMQEYIRNNEIFVSEKSFEFYLTDPAEAPFVTLWKTRIAFPVR